MSNLNSKESYGGKRKQLEQKVARWSMADRKVCGSTNKIMSNQNCDTRSDEIERKKLFYELYGNILSSNIYTNG